MFLTIPSQMTNQLINGILPMMLQNKINIKSNKNKKPNFRAFLFSQLLISILNQCPKRHEKHLHIQPQWPILNIPNMAVNPLEN